MNKYAHFRSTAGLILVTLLLLITACQPGQLFGPQATPTPTPTPTPTITPTPAPNIIAGDWEGDGDFGTVSFTVQSDGGIAEFRYYELYSGNGRIMTFSSEDKIVTDFFFTDNFTVGDSELTFRFFFWDDGQTGIITWEGQTPSGAVEGSGKLDKK